MKYHVWLLSTSTRAYFRVRRDFHHRSTANTWLRRGARGHNTLLNERERATGIVLQCLGPALCDCQEDDK